MIGYEGSKGRVVRSRIGKNDVVSLSPEKEGKNGVGGREDAVNERGGDEEDGEEISDKGQNRRVVRVSVQQYASQQIQSVLSNFFFQFSIFVFCSFIIFVDLITF